MTGTPVLSNVSTERRSGAFLGNVAIPGWTLEGSSSQIYGLDSSGDRAVWLNEGGVNGISRAITGLTAGSMYTLSFQYWGDNVTGPFTFLFQIAGIITNVVGTHSGQNTGMFSTVNFSFIATSAMTTLRFTETSDGPASVLLDNISITGVAAVPEFTSYDILFLGPGLVLLMHLRKKVVARSKFRSTAVAA